MSVEEQKWKTVSREQSFVLSDRSDPLTDRSDLKCLLLFTVRSIGSLNRSIGPEILSVIHSPIVADRSLKKALVGASTTSLSYGVLISRILLSHGVAIGPNDSLAKGRGPITYRTISQSTSHVDDDSEDEDQGDAAREVDPPFEQQMPTYFQDFENRLYDQSTQIELLEQCMDSQFHDVFAQMEQLNIGNSRIEGKLDTLLTRFPPPQ